MIRKDKMSSSPIKCIFIGLENSGKTSILTILEERFAQIGKMKPTQKVVRSIFNILGLPIIIWDMGGQECYQKEYLSEMKYYENTNILFYVVDIQDPDRFIKSLDYFFNILQILIMLRLKPRILVLFHKSDPDIKDQPYILENTQVLKGLFLDLPETLDITFHHTSIYDYDGLSSIFVKGILKILPKGQIIQDVLTDFMKKIEASAIMLLDENVLTIAEAYSDENSSNICKICGPHFVTMAEKLHKYNLYTPETIEVEMHGWLFFKHIIYENARFYLIFFTENHENFSKINELLTNFTKDVFNIIKFVL